MRKTLIALFFMLASFTGAMAQTPFFARLYQTLSSDCDSLTVRIALFRNPTTVNQSRLGSSDFVVNFNRNALDTGTLVQRGTYDAATRPQAYEPITYTTGWDNRPASNSGAIGYFVVRVSQVLSNSTAVQTIRPQARNNRTSPDSLVATIKFAVRNGALTSGIEWRQPANIGRNWAGLGTGTLRDYSTRSDFKPFVTFQGSNPTLALRNQLSTSPVLSRVCQTGTMDLSWTNVPGATRYEVVFRTVNTPGIQRLVLQPGVTTASVGLATGVTTGKVRAHVRAFGSCSEAVSDTVECDLDITSCPTIDITGRTRIIGRRLVCAGSPVEVEFDPSGLNLGANPSYSFDDGQTFVTVPRATLNFNQTTVVRVRVRSTAGCPSNVDQVTVRIKAASPGTTVTPVVNNASPCSGNTIKLTFTTNAPTSDSLRFSWRTTGGGTLTPGTGDTTIYSSAASDAGQQVTFTLVEECSNISVTASIPVTFQVSPDASFTIEPASLVRPLTVVAGEPINFSITNFNSTNTYVFTPGDGTQGLVVTSQRFSHTYLNPGQYQVRLRATNTAGCSPTDFVLTITVEEQLNLFVPNAVIPASADDNNKNLRVYGTGVAGTDFEFYVYSRWGAEVYSAKSFTEARNQGWNGKVNNSGAELPAGVYTYLVRGKFSGTTGKTFEKTGTITLVR